MRRLSICCVLMAPLALPDCGAGPQAGGAHVGTYVGGPVRLECAPFARNLSGVRLWGPAADWWRKADGQYLRGSVPQVGSVLVLKRSARLPSGHVAVVTRVLSRREILVTQANWVRNRVSEDQPVIDVSPTGDWSEIRMWWPPANQMGTAEYSAWGFVRSVRPATREQLAAATTTAIRMAAAGM